VNKLDSSGNKIQLGVMKCVVFKIAVKYSRLKNNCKVFELSMPKLINNTPNNRSLVLKSLRASGERSESRGNPQAGGN